jgi:mannose-1-phosphate guanylyltransferase
MIVEESRMYASILAGGIGTRLWPLSTRQHPKQFLRLLGERTMLQETVDRLTGVAPLDQMYIVTFNDYRDDIRQQLPELPAGNIILEPAGRGTAASIGLAATLIAARDPHAVMGSFHADHSIRNDAAFREALRFAEGVAHQGFLVTLGIHPSYAETGYGYIKYGEALSHTEGLTAHHVEAFVEKPPRDTAEAYLSAGNYVWNAGIFCWRVDRILEEIERLMPEVSAVLREVHAVALTSGGRMTPAVEAAMQRAWPRLRDNVTIDVGVMEHADRIAVIPVEVGWDDIGNWSQMARLFPVDAAENSILGVAEERHFEVRSHDNLVYSATGRPIAIAGVSGLVVVDTPDGLLICAKSQAHLVKEVADNLQPS